MNVWVVWERCYQSHSVADERRLTIIKVCATEEHACHVVKDLTAAQKDRFITYHHEKYAVAS